MAKAPKLEDKQYDILHNIICLRLMKNDASLYELYGFMYLAFLRNASNYSQDWNNTKKYESYIAQYMDTKHLGMIYYYILAADYIIFRLGYRTKLKQNIEQLKLHNRISNNELKWVVDKYEGFKRSCNVSPLVRGIGNIGIEQYLQLYS